MRMTKIAQAFSCIEDVYINESHPAAVLAAKGALPRAEGPVRRFLNSGWGAAVLSAAAALVVLTGIVMAGHLGAGGPGTTPGAQPNDTQEGSNPHISEDTPGEATGEPSDHVTEDASGDPADTVPGISVSVDIWTGMQQYTVSSDYIVSGRLYRCPDSERVLVDISQPRLESGGLAARAEALRADAIRVSTTPELEDWQNLQIFDAELRLIDLPMHNGRLDITLYPDGTYYCIIPVRVGGFTTHGTDGLLYEVEEAEIEIPFCLILDRNGPSLSAPEDSPFRFEYSIEDYTVEDGTVFKPGDYIYLSTTMTNVSDQPVTYKGSSSLQVAGIQLYHITESGVRVRIDPELAQTDDVVVYTHAPGAIAQHRMEIRIPETAPAGTYHLELYCQHHSSWCQTFPDVLTVEAADITETTPSDTDARLAVQGTLNGRLCELGALYVFSGQLSRPAEDGMQEAVAMDGMPLTGKLLLDMLAEGTDIPTVFYTPELAKTPLTAITELRTADSVPWLQAIQVFDTEGTLIASSDGSTIPGDLPARDYIVVLRAGISGGTYPMGDKLYNIDNAEANIVFYWIPLGEE